VQTFSLFFQNQPYTNIQVPSQECSTAFLALMPKETTSLNTVFFVMLHLVILSA